MDESNRASFLKLFNMQMNALNAEQAFVISQNLSQMANVPMDVIQLGDAGIQPSKIHNIIYINIYVSSLVVTTTYIVPTYTQGSGS